MRGVLINTGAGGDTGSASPQMLRRMRVAL